MTFITRFAPSPTGPLHLGHAFSALTAHGMARAARGVLHLRIDDLDQSRSRPEWEARICDDLRWLRVDWSGPVWRQSERLPRYRAALQALWDCGLLYPCICSRADIRAAAAAPQEGAPLQGPDGIVYPGTCRPATPPTGPLPEAPLRLDMARALARLDAAPSWQEKGRTVTAAQMAETVGDVVLARRDMGASYHLAVVLDDADQQITHVIRGEDLLAATPIHVLIQKLMSLPSPCYHHHRLIRDASGRRLAKRDDARAIATYRAAGQTPADIRRMVGL